MSRAFEDSEQQASTIEGAVQEINKLSVKSNLEECNRNSERTGPKKPMKIICYSCGIKGHMRKDPKYPAKGKQCRKCKQFNHFQECVEHTLLGKRKERKRIKQGV